MQAVSNYVRLFTPTIQTDITTTIIIIVIVSDGWGWMDGWTRLFSALQKKFCPISTRTEHSSLAICSLTRSLRIYTLTYEGHRRHEAQDDPVRVHWTNSSTP